MTRKEFFSGLQREELNLTSDESNFIEKELQKLDKAAASRAEKTAAKKLEDEEMKKKLEGTVLGEDPITATIAAEFLEISVQKASSLLRGMVEEGRVLRTEVEVKGKGIQKGYYTEK